MCLNFNSTYSGPYQSKSTRLQGHWSTKCTPQMHAQCFKRLHLQNQEGEQQRTPRTPNQNPNVSASVPLDIPKPVLHGLHLRSLCCAIGRLADWKSGLGAWSFLVPATGVWCWGPIEGLWTCALSQELNLSYHNMYTYIYI